MREYSCILAGFTLSLISFNKRSLFAQRRVNALRSFAKRPDYSLHDNVEYSVAGRDFARNIFVFIKSTFKAVNGLKFTCIVKLQSIRIIIVSNYGYVLWLFIYKYIFFSTYKNLGVWQNFNICFFCLLISVIVNTSTFLKLYILRKKSK